jgi:hypothetical protein
MTTSLSILALIAAAASDLVVLLAMRRAAPALNYLSSIIVAFVAGLSVLVLISLYGPNAHRSIDDFGILILNVLTYAALGYGIFTFINLSATSLRIRIIRAIYNSESGILDEQALRKLYDADDMVSARIGRLIAWRQLEVREGRYFASPKAVFAVIHGTLARVKRFIYGANRKK